jgi:hypothetical protein
MRSKILRNFLINLVSISLLSLGLSQTASAGVIGTQMVIQSEARDARITRVEATLARNDVARQLVLFGVDPLAVKSRVGNMTEAELIQLEGRLDQQVAGGSAVAIVGAVFIVLIILEIVGITDIFKSA